MAAILNVDTVRNLSNNVTLATSGSVVGFQQVFSTEYVNFAAAVTGDGLEVYPLRLTITPKSANNILIMEWMLGGEPHTNVGFLVHRDGALITSAGEQGYNNAAGNERYSCLVAGWYDANNDSTPSNQRLTYHCTAGSTATRTYAPAVRSTYNTVVGYRMNRYYTTADEFNTSYGYIMEIAV